MFNILDKSPTVLYGLPGGPDAEVDGSLTRSKGFAGRNGLCAELLSHFQGPRLLPAVALFSVFMLGRRGGATATFCDDATARARARRTGEAFVLFESSAFCARRLCAPPSAQ